MTHNLATGIPLIRSAHFIRVLACQRKRCEHVATTVVQAPINSHINARMAFHEHISHTSSEGKAIALRHWSIYQITLQECRQNAIARVEE